jgi:hypothetical protein
MTHSLGIKLVEAYLLVVGVVHALAAAALTWPKRKYIAKKPMERARLAVSGTVLLLFLVLHLWHFRFGKGEAEGYTKVRCHFIGLLSSFVLIYSFVCSYSSVF